MSLEHELSRIADGLECLVMAIKTMPGGIEVSAREAPAPDGAPVTLEKARQVLADAEKPLAGAKPGPGEPASAPAEVTLDSLRERCEQLSMQGHRDKLIAILKELGAARLQDLPAERLPEMAQRLDQVAA